MIFNHRIKTLKIQPKKLVIISKKLHILWKAKIQLEHKNFDKAIKLLESLLDYPHILKRDKLYLLDILASIVINYGEMKYLQKADLWTEQALVLGNDIKTIQGTRGSILIEMGRYNEGKEMLLPLTEAGNTATDIAISCCYIEESRLLLR